MSARSQKFMQTLKTILIRVTLFVLVLAIAGTVYQTAATEADRKNLPAPGNLIDVGGFKMHIYCMGEGSPTVILETLSGGTSSYWGWVQPNVAKETRVCVYDRAGRGWSEADPEPVSLERTVRNLHVLLTNANIEGPYLMVGHSIGGLYVRQFTADYPDQVVGMVLVDASNAYQFDRYPEMWKETEDYLRVAKYLPAVSRLGIGRLFFALGGEIDFAQMPEPQKSEIKAAWSSPDYFESQYAENAAGRIIFKDAQRLGDLGDLPLVVLSQGRATTAPTWVELQNELPGLSTNSTHITVDGATHVSLAFDPEHAGVVSQAIMQLLGRLRAGTHSDL